MDDGKRAASVLEVDSSPLRATKGGVWGGISPGWTVRTPCKHEGSVDSSLVIYMVIQSLAM